MLRSIDTLLFGRVTYELNGGVLAHRECDPRKTPVIIHAMNNLPKIVFSRTLERVEWNNSRLVKDHLAEEVARLKQQPGKDLVIFGSGSNCVGFYAIGADR